MMASFKETIPDALVIICCKIRINDQARCCLSIDQFALPSAEPLYEKFLELRNLIYEAFIRAQQYYGKNSVARRSALLMRLMRAQQLFFGFVLRCFVYETNQHHEMSQLF
jgi:hypothetical protein